VYNVQHNISVMKVYGGMEAWLHDLTSALDGGE